MRKAHLTCAALLNYCFAAAFFKKASPAKVFPRFPKDFSLSAVIHWVKSRHKKNPAIKDWIAESKKMVGVAGFEPATFWSQTRRATNCAILRLLFQIPIMYHAFGKIKARHIIFSVFLSFKSHKKCTGALCFFRQDQFSAVPDHRYRSIIFVFIQQNCGNTFCFFHTGYIQFQ